MRTKSIVRKKKYAKSVNGRKRSKNYDDSIHFFNCRTSTTTSPKIDLRSHKHVLWNGDVLSLLKLLPNEKLFDLVVTSPPYNLGKEYESKVTLDAYLEWQGKIVDEICRRLKPNGSICWQVGNYVDNGHIVPLDILLHPLFVKNGLKLRNRIVWRFGHGLHSKRRFSGRYEVVMWYTNGDDYTFNLDAVRIPSKYPGKRHYKGPKVGEYSSNPLGKNPEDVWEIPNVKSNHIEKTSHPCQFPVGLIERLVLALSNTDDLVFDPFLGVGSSGVAAALHKRRFIGAELKRQYADVAKRRIMAALKGKAKYRPHSKPIYDHTNSKLSIRPAR
jgi:adenine-specific DNA-methyltransferase